MQRIIMHTTQQNTNAFWNAQLTPTYSVDRIILSKITGREMEHFRERIMKANSTDLYQVVESITNDGKVGKDLSSTIRLGANQDEVLIGGGWGGQKYSVELWVNSTLPNGVREMTYIQGFTETAEDPTVTGQFDPNMMVYINRVNTYRESNGHFSLQYSLTVFKDRWGQSKFRDDTFEQMSNENYNGINSKVVGLRANDLLANLSDSTLGVPVIDKRRTLEATVTTSNIQLDPGNYMSSLVNSMGKGAVGSILSGENGMTVATSNTTEVSLGTIGFISELLLSSEFTDMANRTSVTYLPWAFIMKYATVPPQVQNTSVNMAEVQTGAGITQDYLASESIEMKLSRTIAEAAGGLLASNGLRSLCMSVRTDVLGLTPTNPYESRVLNDVYETIAPISPMATKALVLKALDDISESVHRIMPNVVQSYFVEIQLIGSAYIEVKISLNGQHGVASTHSFFANGVTSSLIGTQDALQHHTAEVQNLYDGIHKGLETTMNGAESPQMPPITPMGFDNNNQMLPPPQPIHQKGYGGTSQFGKPFIV